MGQVFKWENVEIRYSGENVIRSSERNDFFVGGNPVRLDPFVIRTCTGEWLALRLRICPTTGARSTRTERTVAVLRHSTSSHQSARQSNHQLQSTEPDGASVLAYGRCNKAHPAGLSDRYSADLSI